MSVNQGRKGCLERQARRVDPMFERAKPVLATFCRTTAVHTGTANIYYESLLARDKTTSAVTDSIVKERLPMKE